LREVEHSGEKAQALASIDSIRKRHRDRRVKDMKQLKTLSVRAAPGSRTRGLLMAGPWMVPVALGRGGILANKREGDGATPRGTFRLKRLWWRADRDPRPETVLPLRKITADDAWCEDPADRRYNRPIKVPPGAPGDRLRRGDHLYDFIIEIDHNTRPRIARRGSAVFIHVARPDLAPSAGCVTLPKARLRGLLRQIGPNTRIVIS
jgi:L,D-peptidoglycan transpeptidase YkuD (ErfK/YbiS/YcfS/YnhG family)